MYALKIGKEQLVSGETNFLSYVDLTAAMSVIV